MKFGQSDNPGEIDIPEGREFPKGTASASIPFLVGLGQWNRSKVKNFCPPGIDSELAYYSHQFNSVELNATFARIFRPSQIKMWSEMTADNFTFVPKVPGEISHELELRNYEGI